MLKFLNDSKDFVCLRIGLIAVLVFEIELLVLYEELLFLKLTEFNVLFLIILFKLFELAGSFLICLFVSLFSDGFEIDIGFFKFSKSDLDFVSPLNKNK